MKNSIGTSVILTLAGESHGPGVIAVLDGMAAGVKVDELSIAAQLNLRRPVNFGESARREQDEFRILSGVLDGHATGAPITFFIPNEDVRPRDYQPGPVRPSHADYPSHMKYEGFEDYRGGGQFSGRLTAGICAAGAVALDALKAKGIRVGSHILSCGGVSDRPFAEDPLKDIENLYGDHFPVLSDVAPQMREAIAAAASAGDSVGGVVQTAVTGLPAGLGEPWFGSLDGSIAAVIMSIRSVKGIEFGDGFRLAGMRGSQANDAYVFQDGQVRTLTNHGGGVAGGMSTGMPLIFSSAVKPTSSISLPQRSVNPDTHEEVTLSIKGRHDPAIVRRICPVINCMTALVICDLLALRYGTDYLR